VMKGEGETVAFPSSLPCKCAGGKKEKRIAGPWWERMNALRLRCGRKNSGKRCRKLRSSEMDRREEREEQTFLSCAQVGPIPRINVGAELREEGSGGDTDGLSL